MLKLLRLFFPALRPGRSASAAAAVAELGAQVPLPATLAARLRTIPQTALGCDDVERLYAATQRVARGAAADPAAERHLAGCARCRETYGALATVFRLLPVPMPARLRFRLAALRRAQRPLPVWLTDFRFAAAACGVATALVVAVFGSPLELLGDADLWRRRAAIWQEHGEQTGLRVWGQVAGRLEGTFAQGKESFTTYGRMWGQLLDTSAHVFIPQNLTDRLERYLSSEGDNDGQPSTNV